MLQAVASLFRPIADFDENDEMDDSPEYEDSNTEIEEELEEEYDTRTLEIIDRETLKVGDKVDVRDDEHSFWEPGEVVEMLYEGPHIRKDGYDGAYFWNYIRYAAPPHVLQQEAISEKLKRRQIQKDKHVAMKNRIKEKAAKATKSGVFLEATKAQTFVLNWDLPRKEEYEKIIQHMLPRNEFPDISASDLNILRASISVYLQTFDFEDLLDTLSHLEYEEIIMKLKTFDDIQFKELLSKCLGFNDEQGKQLGLLRSESGDEVVEMNNHFEDTQNCMEELRGSDVENVRDISKKIQILSSRMLYEIDSSDISINSSPQTLLLFQVVSLIIMHLNLDQSLSINQVVSEASNMLGIQFPLDFTIRQKLNEILYQVQSS